MQNYRRSHTCGELRLENVGETVRLSGWVHRRRDHGGLIFIDLRDRFGLTQLVFDPKQNLDTHTLAEKLRAEWVISVSGIVVTRTEGMENPQLATGSIEVIVNKLEVLSKAKTPPFSISDETLHVHEELRLKYRSLDIRRGILSNNLIIRHHVMLHTRNYLSNLGFLEISTPILGKSTPEGARDYLVPSRVHPAHFYALPQSPQLYKQLLMMSGMDRYFQIATCFRDEDLRADRQPEFTQIDIEMSFGTPQDDLMPILEGLVKLIFKEIATVDISTPFRKIPYQDCMEKYGCDRPDLRFGMELKVLDDIAKDSEFEVFQNIIKDEGTVKGFCVPSGAEISRKTIEEYTEFVRRFGVQGLAWMKFQQGTFQSSIVKFFTSQQLITLAKRFDAKEGDLLLMIADQPSKANQALDHLRRHIAKERSLIPAQTYEFLWVTDFPLFSFDQETQRLQSEHHPFTSPHPEDIDLLDKAPLKARSSGYDLVLNGYEIGGGSQRIHEPGLQEKIFELIRLNPHEIEEKFGFFIDALSYGTPPHLGIALGLDRLVMLLAGTDNIRDVIAFPKTQNASDLMNGCPSPVAKQQLEELKIQFHAEKS